MISTPDSGKNLQTLPHGADDERGNEIGHVLTSTPNDTRPALLYSSAPRKRMHSPSVAARKSVAPRAKYGGRRLRYRDLDNLKPWQIELLHKADTCARISGHPLNMFVTIYWAATFPGVASMPATFRRGFKRMAQWLRDNSTRFAFVYVHENPGDLKPNSHMLVHVPRRLRDRFAELAPIWFHALDAGVQVEQRSKPGKPDTRLQYMAKGGDELTCRRFKGHRAKGGQGPVNIKRAGAAQWLYGFWEQYAHACEERAA